MSITLDTALDVNVAFVSLAVADAYLEEISVWNLASDEVKEEALVVARYFIEDSYTCTIAGSIPEELQYANSVLAVDYVKNSSYFETSPNIKRKRVKAGSVESEVYNIGGGKQLPPSWNRVKAILAPVMKSTSGLNFFTLRA